MNMISLKLPRALHEQLEVEARGRGLSKSAVIRDCLEEAFRQRKKRQATTCLDLMGDLFGSQPGPRDASVNKNYLKGFGREGRAAH